MSAEKRWEEKGTCPPPLPGEYRNLHLFLSCTLGYSLWRQVHKEKVDMSGYFFNSLGRLNLFSEMALK